VTAPLLLFQSPHKDGDSLLKQAATCLRFVKPQADGEPITDRISAALVPHLSISRTMAAVLSAILRCRGKPCDCVRRDMLTQSHLADVPAPSTCDTEPQSANRVSC